MQNKLFFISIPLLFFLICCELAFCQTVTPHRYDIVISEIMADPTPVVGLPAAEYVELHSRLPVPCHLVGWKLKIGNTLKQLPALDIDSAGYVVLIAAKYLEDFAEYSPHVYTLSSLSLTDGGQTLVLYDADDQVIHSVSYRQKWHSEPIKQDGGWSLEMLDESLPCWGEENWNSSISPLGGTPGLPNAASSILYDIEPPVMERITLLDSLTVRVFFSEPVNLSSSISPFCLHAAHSSSTAPSILEVIEVPYSFSALDLRLSLPLVKGQTYTLEHTGELADCAGNEMQAGSSMKLGVPEKPERGDLIINEVLSHPFDGTDADFIEIFNKSSKIIDLKDVKIGSGGDTMPQKAVWASSSGMQLFPNRYCALCKNKKLIQQQYVCPAPLNLLLCDSLPAYNNDEGVVFLTDKSLQTIDRLHYTEDMHYPKLQTTEGVSLERLSPTMPTQNPDNWHSAAETVGFATPGYANSQQLPEGDGTEFSISPAVISPDNDGFEDFAEFTLRFPEPDNRLTLRIFDANGHDVSMLANNVLCGSEASFRWDGLDDNRNRLPSGMYVVIAQYWDIQGKTGRKRKVVSIAGW